MRVRLPSIAKGMRRRFVICRAHRRVAFYDFQPYSLSNPVMGAMACGCDPKHADTITEALAREKLAQQNREPTTRAGWAMAACREIIDGDGTDASIQRTIDKARRALGRKP
jgi:hypothetical protein